MFRTNWLLGILLPLGRVLGSTRGIARTHRNNMIEELMYGSYHAYIRSELAPKD